MTAYENVELPLGYQGMAKEKRQALVLQALEKVGLSERASHLPVDMSGGEQQRVAIARAMVIRPQLILADEPTGNLDRDTSAEIMELLRRPCLKNRLYKGPAEMRTGSLFFRSSVV